MNKYKKPPYQSFLGASDFNCSIFLPIWQITACVGGERPYGRCGQGRCRYPEVVGIGVKQSQA
jgi:hypothetical protein